jgi:hypothetical protein
MQLVQCIANLRVRPSCLHPTNEQGPGLGAGATVTETLGDSYDELAIRLGVPLRRADALADDAEA